MVQDKNFLQSEHWRKFQEAVGRKTFYVSSSCSSPSGRGCHEVTGEGDLGTLFSASIVEHILPIVGKYLYSPKGPIMEHGAWSVEQKTGMQKLVELAKKEDAGWIRIEPESKELLELIRENISENVVKAPHDMQPRELFVLDISKTTENLLCEMKTKTRYNVGIAAKKSVVITNSSLATDEEKELYLHAFLRLTKEMAKRHGISAHPDEYYQKMIEILPSEMLRIYVAKYDGKIIAANLVLFYGDTVTYLHGASGSLHRNLMAPFSLQWQAILDAKALGYAKYDFGGIKTVNGANSWEGITTFKTGFSTKTKPVVFPGSYDIIINPRKYWVYRGLQAAKSFAVKFRK